MCKFLRNYQNTPHAVTKTFAATALFGRPKKARLPQQEKSLNHMMALKTMIMANLR